ncbi:MASE1 domain-containing protein [Vibrio cyclitrophicus]|uniref:MASE1 domain-containing sensor histidine kinase n=1 Tax=Vibrio cyclitrophicus TaxID=47951 RepID=UPI00035D08F9|nr:MASE1 domain-containing protein [Vibrio cyclitrophicus]OEE81566.1 histidine kinase [Vibrio cyclitrophicus FF160]OEF75436.1 histidine kinase [Vibrio cyclitrophicus 1F111]PMI44521.1 histidine kinase [Vibrio cyclitrophicus]
MQPSPLHTRPIFADAFSYAFGFLIYSISWFCLWNISRYLSPDILLAGLLLPSGLKLVAFTLARRPLWRVFVASELMVSGGLVYLLAEFRHEYLLPIFAFLPYFLAIPFHRCWKNLTVYWQKILALTSLTVIYGLLCGLTMLLLFKPLAMPVSYIFSTTISALTGGLLLAPFLYLLYDYLQKKIWLPLSPTLIHQEVRLRPSALLWGIAFFSIGLVAELTLLDQMKPLALLIILLPNIFMAYQYGWQGGVLASVINSILLTTARQISGSFESDQELQIFMITQALVGLGLGIAISRQYLLAKQLQKVNKDLESELVNKQHLALQLVQVEEAIRKSVARELHDEIGQNITAIQIQAMLADRTSQDEMSKNIASTINTLALRIHSSTRQLLTQLRPHTLDELGLEDAIRQLSSEMRFADRHIDFKLNFGLSPNKLDDITAVTLYRITQELLNNVSKHANATEVKLSIMPGDTFSLELRDNGQGLPDDWPTKGQGLKGIKERVSALGGEMTIQTRQGSVVVSEQSERPNERDSTSFNGTRITINLPTST